jgi:hypothetical protein
MKQINIPLRTLNPRRRSKMWLLWLVNLLIKGGEKLKKESVSTIRKLDTLQRILMQKVAVPRAKVQSRRVRTKIKTRKRTRVRIWQKRWRKRIVRMIECGW